jgi:hypothetical protein
MGMQELNKGMAVFDVQIRHIRLHGDADTYAPL